MKTKLIGGDFGINPRSSNYINKMHNAFHGEIDLINGGSYESLIHAIDGLFDYDVVIWMPNIDNSHQKLVQSIKKKFPNIILIQSKFNNGKYTDIDLVARVLKSKANLLIEFTKNENLITSKIIDPLGNIFYHNTNIIDMVATLQSRINELVSFTRMSSICVSEKKEVQTQLDFFKIVESYGQKYHSLIHAVNQDRFLGNCSFRVYNFRCSYGFPSSPLSIHYVLHPTLPSVQRYT